MKKMILELRRVSKNFSSGNTQTTILNDLSLGIRQGDFTIIMGPSGAGKSTLLYVASGMEKASAGEILYQSENITKDNERQMAKLRSNDFGFVFQQANLVSNLTLEENVCVAGYMKRGSRGMNVRKRANLLLDKMNVTSARRRLPSEVSGGEAQRAAVARAVINEPEILFADEPTGALNRQNTMEVLDLLCSLNEAGQSIVMVTHDLHAAIRGNRILYLEDGQIKGEKELGSYLSENGKTREEKLKNWLSDMEW